MTNNDQVTWGDILSVVCWVLTIFLFFALVGVL